MDHTARKDITQPCKDLIISLNPYIQVEVMAMMRGIHKYVNDQTSCT